MLTLGGRHFLIDCGISHRRLTEGLATQGLGTEDIEAVLITHTHTDHVSGLPVWFRQTGLRFIVPEKALRRASVCIGRGALGSRLFSFVPGEDYALDGVTFTPFAVKHDAPETVGLSFDDGTFRFTYLTDLGAADEEYAGLCEGADLLFLEANHEPELVEVSHYPAMLKRRILSPKGHLSNGQALSLLASLKRPPRKVILGHLSEVNNSPERVRERIDASAVPGMISEVHIASQREPTTVTI